VVKAPAATLRDRLNAPPDWDAAMLQGPEVQPDGPSWFAIFIPTCGVLFLVLAFVLYRYATFVPPPPLFHSSKAKIVQGSIAIEPERDPAIADGRKIGVVKPQSFALQQTLADAKHTADLPAALRLDPSLTSAEAALKAHEASTALEASIVGASSISPSGDHALSGQIPTPPMPCAQVPQAAASILEGPLDLPVEAPTKVSHSNQTLAIGDMVRQPSIALSLQSAATFSQTRQVEVGATQGVAATAMTQGRPAAAAYRLRRGPFTATSQVAT